MELEGFADAAELAYGAVIYLQMKCADGTIQIAFVSSKTKVAQIKRLTIPHLENCVARLLAQLIHDAQTVLELPLSRCYEWTDSIIVLHWLIGNPKHFKTYICNRVSNILELFGPKRCIILEALSIWRTVHRVACSLQNSSVMSYGVKDLSSSSIPRPNGQINH